MALEALEAAAKMAVEALEVALGAVLEALAAAQRNTRALLHASVPRLVVAHRCYVHGNPLQRLLRPGVGAISWQPVRACGPPRLLRARCQQMQQQAGQVEARVEVLVEAQESQ